MPIDEKAELLPTILDRLAPIEEKTGELGSRDFTVEDSIARDLEILLNTRREEFLVPPEFEQTATSIVNFGVPDPAKCGSLRFGPEQAKLCRWIEEAIRNFEPRLRNVSVRVVDRENVAPILRFRIEAKAEYTSEKLAFELGLKRDSGRLAVLPR